MKINDAELIAEMEHCAECWVGTRGRDSLLKAVNRIKGLSADSDRLDWLQKRRAVVVNHVEGEVIWTVTPYLGDEQGIAQNLREAIDAAMAKCPRQKTVLEDFTFD
jgi:hypothetical protein